MNYYKIMREILVYIEENIEQDLSIDTVSKRFNFSKYYFHRLFTAIVGSTYNQYLLTRKLNRALYLMSNTDLNLTQISYQLGFSSPSAFTNHFKKKYGKGPLNYKKSSSFLPLEDIPEIVERSVKNLNGDIIVDFTLVYFHLDYMKGPVFEIDLAEDTYRDKISAMSKMLLVDHEIPQDVPAFMLYSNCKPNSTKFNAMFCVPYEFESDEPFIVESKVSPIFCARFEYKGNLLDISDIFTSDFARFLRISKLESENHEIELIQSFQSLNAVNDKFVVYVPIEEKNLDHV